MDTTSADILENFRRGRSADIDLTIRASYRDLLARLGNPQNKLPPIIHVAGTNGKGSICAFLRAMVEAAGYKAHVYTSPHLVTFHERIRLAGQLISEDELTEILQDCERLAESNGVTYFEAATAAAFVAFARHPADVTILEVGLGGRLDATNIISSSVASVISRVSFDHREYLGTTLAEIAYEKAGIMRKSVPCFTAYQPAPEVVHILRAEAERLQSKMSIGKIDWWVEPKGDSGFHYQDDKRQLNLPLPALLGQHQLWNAGLAIAASAALPITISDIAIQTAMQKVVWPARLQRLTEGALVSLLPQGWELWLDGGHNDSAGEVLAVQIEAWRKQDGDTQKPLQVILGMLSTKVPAEFLEPIAHYVDELCAVNIDGETLNCPAHILAQEACNIGICQTIVASNIQEALNKLTANLAPGRVLICGSLYLAGQVLKLNQTAKS